MTRRSTLGALAIALVALAGCSTVTGGPAAPATAEWTVTPAPVPTDRPTPQVETVTVTVPVERTVVVTSTPRDVSGSVDWQVGAEPRTLADGRVVYDVTLAGNNAAGATIENVTVWVVLQTADGEFVDRARLRYDATVEPDRWVDFPDRTTDPFPAEVADRADRVVTIVRYDVST